LLQFESIVMAHRARTSNQLVKNTNLIN
jgi:hypothetical protein